MTRFFTFGALSSSTAQRRGTAAGGGPAAGGTTSAAAAFAAAGVRGTGAPGTTEDAAVAETAVRDTAVRDAAHAGDIHGAFGTVRLDAADRPSGWGRRLRYLLAIMGPGLIVMMGDNDAGGVATYGQAGQNYGTRLLWVLLLLVPVLVVNQEMVVRLGAVTGVGHARLIHERFGRFWAAYSIADLVLLNGLTIVTEFIGVALAGDYFGIPRWISVLGAAALLVAFTVTGSFRRWERWMYGLIAVNVLVLPLLMVVHPAPGRLAHDFLVPGLPAGQGAGVLLLIIAMVGTTVAPWQLFFQQSNVADKRITPRWISYERADTVIGSVAVVAGAAAVITIAAAGFAGTPLHGRFTDAAGIARGLADVAGHHAGGMFALLLLDASLIGAAAVTLATSYALGDVAGAKHSLHRGVKDAPVFYGAYTLFVLIGAAVVLVPGAPLGLITEGVQALAGVLLPSASVFLVLLCNDRDVLGPWVNRPWLNALAGVVIGVLVLLSLILTVVTLFPRLSVAVPRLAGGGAAAAGVCVAAGYVAARVRGRWARAGAPGRDTGVVLAAERLTWRMPPLAELPKAVWSPGRKAGMTMLRLYLVAAVGLVIVKIVQLAMAS